MLKHMLKEIDAILSKTDLVTHIFQKFHISSILIGYSKRRNFEDFELLFETRFA